MKFGLTGSQSTKTGTQRVSQRVLGAAFAIVVLVAAARASAATYIVPDDFATIQAALNTAVAGDTIQVRQQATPCFEAFPGDSPIIDGTGVSGSNRTAVPPLPSSFGKTTRTPGSPRFLTRVECE